ncbi:hypothetical protein EX30DRAFT_92453 [Ascodesmis nigricans]|uniref:Rap-GAP domain-containing protein n=1 Tax=Ascodesmis nigricans TaxID=341454 RepID=A0A4S2N423_9PEZI|nr:hypothetical protein EX30DRAFT_92453 [Ascodesmis nigricans]
MPNTSAHDNPAPEPSRASSGLAKVLGGLRIRNQSNNSTPSAPVTSSDFNRSSSRLDYFPEPAPREEYVLLEKLRKEKPLEGRIQAAESLTPLIKDLPPDFVNNVWYNAQDMVKEPPSVDARKAGLRLLAACMRSFTNTSALDRLRYYQIIVKDGKPAEFDDQLHAMLVLTDGGRNLASFEKEISKTLIVWLKNVYNEASKVRGVARRREETRDRPPVEDYEDAEYQLRELFRFVTDVMKFNFQTFEEQEISDVLGHVLIICRKTGSRKDVESVIIFIQTLATYGSIPVGSLKDTVQVLCGCFAAVPALAELAWTVIANLSRSHMGYQCVETLYTTLRYQKLKEEEKKKESSAVLETAGQGASPELTGLSMPQERIGQPVPKESKDTPHPNTLRGAVMILEKLVEFNGSTGLPKIELPVLFTAFHDALCADSPRLELVIMSAIAKIVAMPEVSSQIFYDEWKVPLDILVQASKRTIETADGTPLERLGVKDVQQGVDRKLGMAIAEKLLEIIQQLEMACIKSEFTYVEGVIEFFLQCFGHLPDSAAKFVIDYYRSEHLCYPSCSEWIQNSKRLVDCFFCTRVRPTEMRISIILLLRDVYETIRDVCDEELIHEPILAALEGFQLETDPKVLEELVKFIEDIAATSSLTMFHRMIDILVDYCRLEAPDKQLSRDVLTISAPRPVSGAYCHHGSLVNIVARGLVEMFARNLELSSEKSVRLYEAMIRIAQSPVCEVDARLTAMRLLFRLRADSENRVFIVQNPECDYLAGVLLRTNSSEPSTDTARPQPLMTSRSAATSPTREDETSSSRSNRSLSATQLGMGRAHTVDRFGISPPPPRRMWTYPEDDPLLSAMSDISSPVLSTYYDPQTDNPPQQGPSDDPSKCARVSLWLECVTPIIQRGANWEIYSYVLCHLPSQLANKTAFRNCKEHIRMLRNIVCEQLHTNRIPSTDLPPEIKKADIAVALIHCLTVLTIFRGLFARSETEGIVKAFQLGLHSWNRTAKPCIHALAVCCYELPMATGKFLSGILSKLSQIITLPVVSVHILEFLSALAKLPSLYCNFVEADFRNILGIAFRYIQHAKETASHQSSRANHLGRSEDDKTDQADLPQYVMTLAYNVLTTWFLSLRLCERPKYVSWIIRGLVLPDGTNQIEEQNEACIDMLQRFTYSESENKPPIKLDNTPGIITKHWLNGMSIFSVQMAMETGISRITVRKPAGTSYYTLKVDAGDLKSTLESKHIEIEDQLELNATDITTQSSVLPSHIILQLFGGLGLPIEQAPIRLPEDDKTRRAIDVLDRIPVVDFHKIGVVYVGAGQTTEQEILSNAMGSPDYTDFVCGLGDLVRLKGADINTGGLDHENDIDGEFMYFWKDRMTEIAFHVVTMMPTHEHDPQFTLKKRHIGNDFVNIVFNNSGLPWRFGTIPSQFNFVTIVISPEAKSSFVSSRLHTRGPEDTVFYRVKVSCKDGFTDISPAQEPKMVSAKQLPSFVRNLALNASVYSHVFSEAGREHISNVRHRLRNIRQIRDRHILSSPFSNPTSPGGGIPGAPNSSISGQGGNTPLQTPRGSIAYPLGHHPHPQQRQSIMGAMVERDRRTSTISTMTKGSNEDSPRSYLNGEPDADAEDFIASFDFSRYT